jgi:hypothetical protein
VIFSEIAKRSGKFIADNSPAILTAMGVTGALTTAYLTGKASFKAAQIIDDLEDISIRDDVPAPTTREKFEAVWTLYIPAVATAGSSIACIILANRIGSRRAAALAATYAISEKAWAEYKEKVVERIGGRKEQDLRDEIAQDRVTRNPPTAQETIVIGGGSVLCYESFTGRYFLSSMEDLKKSQNDLNYRVLNDYYASLTDWYGLIGLPRTAFSDEVGWNSDKMLELSFSTTLTEDGRPCLSVDFAVTPIRDYYRVQ